MSDHSHGADTGGCCALLLVIVLIVVLVALRNDVDRNESDIHALQTAVAEERSK